MEQQTHVIEEAPVATNELAQREWDKSEWFQRWLELVRPNATPATIG